MRFMLEITEGDEVSEITDGMYLAALLRDVANRIDGGDFREPKLHVMDGNGNTVGAFGMCAHADRHWGRAGRERRGSAGHRG
jgi:hypothetical protein